MEDILKKILAELEMLRKMQMVELSEKGYSQSKLGSILGLSQTSVSRMMATKSKASPKSGTESN